VLFLPATLPELEDITVYNGWLPAFSRPLSLLSALVNAIKRYPAGRDLTDVLTRPLLAGPAGGPDNALRERIPSLVRHSTASGRGRTVRG
jgi:hypothetical protein